MVSKRALDLLNLHPVPSKCLKTRLENVETITIEEDTITSLTECTKKAEKFGGKVAVSIAKNYKFLSKLDSIIYFSKAKGFIEEFLKDEICKPTIIEMISAFESTGELKFKAFLKELTLYPSGLSILINIEHFPKGLYEQTINHYLKYDLLNTQNELVSDFKIISLKLGLRNCFEIVKDLLSNYFHFKMNFSLENYIKSCLDSKELLKFVKEVKGENKTVENLKASLRILQYSLPQNEYEEFLCSLLRSQNSSTEFRELILCFTDLMKTDSIWVLQSQRKIVNMKSTFKKLKCRAVYSNAVKQMLLSRSMKREEEIYEEEFNQDEVDAIFHEIEKRMTSSSLSISYLQQIKKTRPMLFERKLWPSFVLKQPELSMIWEKELSVVVPEKPEQSMMTGNEEETSVEIAKRILNLLEKWDENDFVDNELILSKNVKTFCALADGPNVELVKFGKSLFQQSQLSSKRKNQHFLQKLFLTSNPFLGSFVMDGIIDQVLYNNLHERNVFLLEQIDSTSLLEEFYMKIVKKSLYIGNIEYCLKVLLIYCRYSLRIKQRLVQPEILWLRDHIEYCSMNPFQTHVELDEFDATVNTDELIALPIERFLELELCCNEVMDVSLIRRLLFLSQFIKERYDMTEHTITCLFDCILTNFSHKNTSVIVLAAKDLFVLNPSLLESFLNCWRRQSLSGSISNSFLLNALETCLSLFGQYLPFRTSKQELESNYGVKFEGGATPERIMILLYQVFEVCTY